ncbi:MAG: hypothetical protein ACRC78_12610 [Planktothrix sp.]
MIKSLGFGKKKITKNDTGEKYYTQMIESLPPTYKPDLGHSIFRVAGESTSLLAVDSIVSNILFEMLQPCYKNGVISLPKKTALIGKKYGRSVNLSRSDLIFSVGDKMGNFEMTNNQLYHFAFDKCCFFKIRVFANKRFLTNDNTQWVMPIKVITCFPEMPDRSNITGQSQTLFRFGST